MHHSIDLVELLQNIYFIACIQISLEKSRRNKLVHLGFKKPFIFLYVCYLFSIKYALHPELKS